MNIFKVTSLIALACATLMVASSEVAELSIHTENISSNTLLQHVAINSSNSSGLIPGSSAKCTPPCTGDSGYMGGNGGAAFDDFNGEQLFGIESMTIRSGEVIDSLQVTYTGGRVAQKHGGNGGFEHTCNTIEDPIIEVVVFHDYVIHYINFIKKSGAICGSYGREVGRKTRLEAPVGMILSSFYGGSDTEYLTALGLYWGRDPATCDKIWSTKGRWNSIKNFPVPTEFTVQIGTTHSDTHIRSDQWSTQVSDSVSAGFQFYGITTQTMVSSTYSEVTAASYQSTFSQTVTETTTFAFPAGTLWQWHFETIDDCGTSFTYKDYQITKNAFKEPCCPPGLFEDPSNPLGFCVNDTVSLKSSDCPVKGT